MAVANANQTAATMRFIVLFPLAPPLRVIIGRLRITRCVPDGIKVDKNGNLFITGPKGIWVWDAKGNHLGTIVLPEQPANLTWGDKDYRTLYITARTSVYRLQMKTQGFVPYLEH